MWETDHGAMLAFALASVRQAQKRTREAAELLARAYRNVSKNPAFPVGELAFRAGLAYAELTEANEADFYLTVALEHRSWANEPEKIRARARSIRGLLRVTLGRHADAEPDLRPKLPQMLSGSTEEKFFAATIGAALDRREYLQPYLDTVFAA